MLKISGDKFTRSHTTATETSKEVLRLLKSVSQIKKISLGVITKSGRSRGGKRVKIKEIPAGLELVVRGQSSIQKIYIYIDGDNKTAIDEILSFSDSDIVFST